MDLETILNGLFEAINKRYSGAYYTAHTMDIVVLFEPVTAKKME